MIRSPSVLDKILEMEKVINFPASPSLRQNLPMVRYSNLLGAVRSLAERGRKVVVVTGFYVPFGNPPATETDGPPGALILAEGLNYLGMHVRLLSDQYAVSTLRAGLQILGLSEKDIPITVFPLEHSDLNHSSRAINEAAESRHSIRFVEEFMSGPLGRDLTHLIFIERVGPNHTLESFLAQDRQGEPPRREFETILPPFLRNRCFSTRLEDITRFTAKTHFLLEFGKKWIPSFESIGIGDRGNEIGCGVIPWEVFKDHSRTGREAVFCCRLKTDYFISCGISNWGGYALLAGIALARSRLDVLEKVSPEHEGRVLDHLVHYGPSIDGITLKQDSSVDGIEFADYVKVIERLKEIVFE